MRHATIAFRRRAAVATYETFTLVAGYFSDGKGGSAYGANVDLAIGSLTPSVYKDTHEIRGLNWDSAGNGYYLSFVAAPPANVLSKLEIWNADESSLLLSTLYTSMTLLGATLFWNAGNVFVSGTTYKVRIYY